MNKSLVDCQKWPAIGHMDPTQANRLPPVQLARTTEQRLAKLQALEDSGVVEWHGYENAMEHLQNIQRANLGFSAAEADEFLINKDFWAGIETRLTPAVEPAKEVTRDLALDDVALEECAEVIQGITKVKRFGMVNHSTGYNNKAPLEEEIGQLYCALGMLTEAWDLDENNIALADRAKREAITKWAGFYERNR